MIKKIPVAYMSIDYDEGVAGSYRAVIVSHDGANGRFEKRLASGDPVIDYREAVEYCERLKRVIMESSSVTHFVFDDPSYKFDENDMLEKI